jgi:hypothetical protein
MSEPRIPMLSLYPKHVYSVFWLLTCILQVPRSHIKARAGISLRVQRRMAEGYIPRESTQQKLRILLRDVQNEIDLVKRPQELPLRDWHDSLVALCQYLRSATRQPSRDPLFDVLRSNIPAYPDKVQRGDLIKKLSDHYTREQILLKAKKLNVIETTNKHRQVLWTLPPHGAPNQPQQPPYRYKKPRGEKKQRLHNKLQAFVMRGPDGRRTVKEIMAKFVPEYSRAYVFQSFHELNFGRETTGFGKDKVVHWFQIYPPTSSAEPDTICTKCASSRLIQFPNGEFLCKDCSHTFTLTSHQEEPHAE